MRKGTKTITFAAFVAFCIGFSAGCQKHAEPPVTPTQNQWHRIQEHILTDEPTPQFPMGTIFGDRVELIGYDLEPYPRAQVGEEFTVTWYWRVLDDMEDRWEIFVHLDSQHRQNLDHEAISNLYSSQNWEVGQIIRDQQTVELDDEFGDSEITMYLGFWRRSDNERLNPEVPGNAELVPEPGTHPRVRLGTFQSYREVPTLEARQISDPPTMDGRLSERAWRSAPRSDEWVHPNSGEEVDGLHTHSRALWDEDALYIGMSARDTDIWATMTERDESLWEEEVLSVYIDPLADGLNYVEIQVNPLGTVFDAVFPEASNRDLPAGRAINLEEMTVAHYVNGTVDDRDRRDNRWSVEIRIPWTSLPDFEGPAEVGTSISVNFYRYDRPAEGAALTAAWNPVRRGTFHQPDKFGAIILVEGQAPRPRPGVLEGTGTIPSTIQGARSPIIRNVGTERREVPGNE